MNLCGRTQPLATYPIEACLGVIKGLGFDGVELCLENPDLAPERLDEATIRRVRQRVEALGLQPYSISYHKDYVYNDTLFAETLQAIRATPRFGAEILILSGPLKKTGSIEEWRRLIGRTRELVVVAEDQGVTLAVEFEPRFLVDSTAELLRLFQAVPSARLAANLDLGHAFLGDPDPLESIRQLGNKIVHGHIENMRVGVHEHLLPPEGDMDLAAYLRALAEVGFQGSLALDLYKHDYEQVAPEALRYLRDLC